MQVSTAMSIGCAASSPLTQTRVAKRDRHVACGAPRPSRAAKKRQPLSSFVALAPQQLLRNTFPAGCSRSAGSARTAHTVAATADGLGICEYDDTLLAFKDHLSYRWERFQQTLASIEQEAGGLAAFAQGYEHMGFTTAEDGTITYREWLPAAQAVSLIGDFNGWDGGRHPMDRGEGGIWSITLPAGSIPHSSRVKLHALKDTGEWVDRVPAWITWARAEPGVMGAKYDGIYWDPPPEQRFGGFQAARPDRPQTLRIYEAHVGMSSTEAKVNSYAEFTRDVLPRIKAAGYNCVQLMAVMEHSYYASFGYHVTSPFAVSSRSGTPEELKALVERAHELGLHVLLDVVHSHISNNIDDGLNGFDFGQHEGDNYFLSGERGYHWLWDSRLYNYDNREVQRYLLSNLRWWMDEYNFDGFRFDGVTSMLYHHHGLQMEFTGNYEEYFGTQTNVDAVVYLMLASQLGQELRPDGPPTMIAEDVSGMPALCRPVAEGGVGFDYRLAMSVPDMWISMLEDQSDEEWSMNRIVSVMCNRRRGVEQTIAYPESHDQSIVGDKTIAFWLIDQEMYTGMADDGTPGSMVVARGVALHQMIRLITLGLGGEGYLNFMGNEFGHPEWIDFPRDGNDWNYDKCRRRFDLADDGLLRYKHLLHWDVAMHALEEATGFASDDHLLVSSQHEEDKVIVFERGDLVFVFNFHPCNTYEEYKIGVRDGGRYKVCLDSDAYEFAGEGRVPHDWAYFSEPAGSPGGEGNFNNRCATITLQTVPARTVQVYEKLLEGEAEVDSPCWVAVRSALDA
ncbi:1,4-alpha-glucan-branching enzyme [Cymbomonas tetramitiformis]|uniref:1,4-alpha-glucan branching enzyme n=1 Tax=Cymbomonas tetramitiformis TaxID=36881 RepID=A0AAE0LHA4_9CHLO|nr:1,4-alpha-glucan-branching enzyme [Cymbomonas tetramitiformis]